MGENAANHTDEWLVSRIYKDLSHLNNKKPQITQFKNEQKMFLQEMYTYNQKNT
jgi:hypothetical protein